MAKAKIENYNGAPAVMIDGKPYPPMFATIRTNKFVKNHTINIEKIISVLDKITCGIEVQDKEWKLQNVSFKFWMHCDSPKDYLEMLNQGSFQSKNGLIKEVDRKINPTENDGRRLRLLCHSHP